MRTGMVLANTPFPPDIRIEKEACILVGAGHDVLVLSRGEVGQTAEERIGGVTAIRHRVHPGSSLRRKLDSLRYLLTLDSPSWRRAMVDLAHTQGAEALHVHDLPYARSAIRAARETGVPVLLDLHENYPAALKLWARRPIDRLLFSPRRAARLERWACSRADAVIVVVSEAKARLVGMGVPAERISIFGNSEPRDLTESAEPPVLPPAEDRLHLVYVGGVAAHRGLDTAVEAMPALLEANSHARLTIVGEGPKRDTVESLRARAAELGVAEAVDLTGRLPFSEAMDRIREASIALVPHKRSAHTDATVPHKLFQYMALGRPVLASDCAPLARIIRETGAGAVFESGNPASLAERALELAEDSRWRGASEAGREATLGEWNLESEGESLLDAYARATAKAGRR